MHPLLELIEPPTKHIKVVEQCLSKGKGILGVLPRNRFIGVVRTLIANKSQRIGPLRKGAIDQSFASQIF